MVEKKSCTQGFTLIELLVVVLIIGILAAIAVPQYQKAVDKSKYAQAQMLMGLLDKEETIYHMVNGTYTFHWEELGSDLPTPESINIFSDQETYNYKWGYCYLHYTNYGVCYAKLNSREKVGYMKFWNSQQPRCWAMPTDSARANALCRNVTNKTTGSVNSNGGFMSYSF